MRAPASGTFVACATWLCARSALADGPPHARAEIAYDRAPDAVSCPDDAGFRTELSRQLGYDPSSEEPTRAAIEVTVRKTRRGGFEGSIRLSDRGRTLGVRSFDGASCPELVSSMALTIGILLEPFASPDLERSDPSASQSPPVRSVPEPAPAPVEPPVSPPRARPVLAVAVGEVQSLGLAPAPSFGIEALASVAVGWWSIDLEGRTDFEAGRTTAAGERVSTSLFVGGASPCFRLSVARACMVALLGTLHGSVSGSGDTQHQSGLFAAIGPRAAIEVRVIGPLAVRGHLDLLFPVNRVVLEQGGAEIWTTSAAAGTLGFDAAALFP